MQWVDDPSQRNVDKMNNGKQNFGGKTMAYLRAKIEELETNSKIHNIRDLYIASNDFK